jgi:DNA-binding transcriptional ArsR family regulator
VQVLTDASQLAAALSPLRMRVLREMQEPESATTLAPRIGLSRQTLNYHLRELEREGFLELVEERPRRGCVERLLKVTSRAFVVNPALFGALADDPEQVRDRFSSAYLIATATAMVRDVVTLARRAGAVEQRLATFTMDCDVGFESPAQFRTFTAELASAVATLAAKYDSSRPGSRRFRVALGSHPVVTKTAADAAAEAARHRRGRRPQPRRNIARRT